MADKSRATTAQAEKKGHPPAVRAEGAGQTVVSETSQRGLELPPAGVGQVSLMNRLPAYETARPLRQSAVLQAQRCHGNVHVQRVLAHNRAGKFPPQESPLAGIVQRRGGRRGRGVNPGGRGPGSIQHAAETTYDVSGATLDDITGQLNGLDGFASQTNAPLGLSGRVTPQRQPDDSYQVTVRWRINDATVQLPRWTDYDAACPAAQQEWDRFLGQTRQHEQEAHVNAAREFVDQLGEEDTVISGATVEELQANLQAKQQELAGRLQAIHDACDHGVGLDAVLHPDNGRCDEE
jgi:predicted secreted Zn-dependent protease